MKSESTKRVKDCCPVELPHTYLRGGSGGDFFELGPEEQKR